MTDQERADWMGQAIKLKVQILEFEEEIVLHPRIFKSGSIGWFASDKLTMDDTKYQLSMSITMIGTKHGYVPYKERVQMDNGHSEAPSPLGPPLGLFGASDPSGPPPNAAEATPEASKPRRKKG